MAFHHQQMIQHVSSSLEYQRMILQVSHPSRLDPYLRNDKILHITLKLAYVFNSNLLNLIFLSLLMIGKRYSILNSFQLSM